ncbi:MAG: BON domain-containing protein [Acidobacteriota bacterium]
MPAGSDRRTSDERRHHQARIKAKLATDVGAATITAVEVNVTNGVVTLAGPKTQGERLKIEAVARGIEGVTSVTNNIQVSAADAAPQPATNSVPIIVPTSSGGEPVYVAFPTPTPVP